MQDNEALTLKEFTAVQLPARLILSRIRNDHEAYAIAIKDALEVLHPVEMLNAVVDELAVIVLESHGDQVSAERALMKTLTKITANGVE